MKTAIINVAVDKTAGSYFLTVRSFEGRPIYYALKRLSNITLVVKTYEEGLTVTVTPVRSAFKPQTKYIRFGCENCVCAKLNFHLIPVESEQNVFLSDHNYGLPVRSAQMNFYSR